MAFWHEQSRNPDVTQQYITWISKTRAVREAAGMFAIARTGVDYQDDEISQINGHLAAIRAEYGLSAEDMMAALQIQEPILRTDWQHQVPEPEL